MPGKCKFQDSWLAKDVYKDWLVKDVQDIHFARCRACCKSIKLQTMGEAALTSHAGGAGHKAAVRKLLEGSLMMTGQVNDSVNQAEDSKEQVAICLQRDALDRITGNDWSDLHHSPSTNSTSHNAELQDVAFPAAYFTAPGTSRLSSQHLQPSGSKTEDAGRRPAQHDSVDLSRLEHQQRSEALEQQQQMKILEWENRMKVLAWEQELVREKRRAARQKEKAFRMKKAYYKAKLKRMGEDLPPSSSSSGDEAEKTSDPTG
ncbi:claudin [Sarotherodon galilaeus]